jgi:hypothetical protein
VDFEFEAIGFELPEIDFRIQSLERPEAADQADELTAAEGRQTAAHHRLTGRTKSWAICMCAGCSSANSTMRAMSSGSRVIRAWSK